MMIDQVGNDFGVGLGTEDMALKSQAIFEFKIVFDDAVVNHGHRPGIVGMGICFGRSPVGCPASMSDSVHPLQGICEQQVLQLDQLALGPANLDFAAVENGDSRRVVTPVF